jgi:flagellar basal-body rod protein FlgC
MSLFQLLSVSASGMSAQRQRAEVHVENLANSETTRTSEGGAYRRKDVVLTSEVQGSPFSAVFQDQMQAGSMGVGVSEVLEDVRRLTCASSPAIPMPMPKGTLPIHTSIRLRKWWT